MSRTWRQFGKLDGPCFESGVCTRGPSDVTPNEKTLNGYPIYRIAESTLCPDVNHRPVVDFSGFNGNKFSQVSCLLDSGSQLNILGKDGFKRLKSLGIPYSRKFDPIIVRSVNNKRLLVRRTASLNLLWDGYPISCEVYIIPSVTMDLILGFQFWKDVGLVVDTQEGKCTFTSDKIRRTVPLQSVTLSHFKYRLAEIKTDLTNGIVASEDVAIPVWDLKHPDLDDSQKLALIEVLNTAFKDAPKGLGRTNLITYDIKLTDPTPFQCRQYPLSYGGIGKANEQLDEWLALDVVEPTTSPYRNPVWIVKQEPRADRMVLDARVLNSKTEMHAYPSPLMDRILTSLGKPNFISKIDLSKAFLQIPLSQESCKFCAFAIPGRGLFSV